MHYASLEGLAVSTAEQFHCVATMSSIVLEEGEKDLLIHFLHHSFIILTTLVGESSAHRQALPATGACKEESVVVPGRSDNGTAGGSGRGIGLDLAN